MVQVIRARPATPKAAARVRRDIDRCLDADLFKALSDPTRLSILACLAKCGRPCSVTEMAACCSVDLSVVSRHLLVLARAGALDTRKEGRTVLYSVRHAALAAQLHALGDAIEACCTAPMKGSCCGVTNSCC